MWDTYDADRSGDLDKEETKKFISDILGNIGGSAEQLSDEEFEEVFITFDVDGSGTIEKEEMDEFIMRLLGVEVKRVHH